MGEKEEEEEEEERKYDEGKRVYTPTRPRGKGWPREVASAGSLGGDHFLGVRPLSWG